MVFQTQNSWNRLYLENDEIAFPAEGVIRIFKGRFPGLGLERETHAGKSILDLGCGDGRHLALFHSLGMTVSAVEITDDIRDVLAMRMEQIGVPADIRTGHAGHLPFEEASFDRLLTWNSCYYMSFGGQPFEAHVAEMARVIKPGGWIIASIPKMSSFIFKNSDAGDPGYRIVRDDYFDGGRNGEVMRCMQNRDDVQESFSTHFENFSHADIDMDWFGLAYHWHVFCAQRKG